MITRARRIYVAVLSRCAAIAAFVLLLGERARREQVVANRLQRRDRFLLHLRAHRMLRELSPFEQVGQPPSRLRADREVVEHPGEVLERRLGRPSRQPVRGQDTLQPRVGGDHCAARIRLGAQVVERLVHRRGEVGREPVLCESELAASALARASRVPPGAECEHDQRGHDECRLPGELGLVRDRVRVAGRRPETPRR